MHKIINGNNFSEWALSTFFSEMFIKLGLTNYLDIFNLVIVKIMKNYAIECPQSSTNTIFNKNK